jgi:hypothetical protein
MNSFSERRGRNANLSGTLANSLVGGVGALGSRLDCDGARFRRVIAWRNWREVLFGYWIVGSFSLRAAQQAGPYGKDFADGVAEGGLAGIMCRGR